MNVLARVMKAGWDETNKPEGYVKGDEFEHFVRDRLFPKDSYDLLFKTHNYAENHDDFIQSSKMPDYKFRSKGEGVEFFVEAKFRTRFSAGVLEWCKHFQLKRYQEIDLVVPVLVAIGLGGRPAAPEKVFLVPIQHIKFVKLFPSFLQRYEVQHGQPITEGHLKRILI